jgi:hypothetical protein
MHQTRYWKALFIALTAIPNIALRPNDAKATDGNIILLSCYGTVIANSGNRGEQYEYLLRIDTQRSTISYGDKTFQAHIDQYFITWRATIGRSSIDNKINRVSGSLNIGGDIRGNCKRSNPLF